MKSKVKAYAKDAMTIGITGVGLGVLAGASSDSPEAASAIGKMGHGLGTMGSVVTMKHTLGILGSSLPKKKMKW